MTYTSLGKGFRAVEIILAFVILTLGIASATAAEKTITLLFTNDVESVYDPIEAFWLDDMEMIGGIAEMTTLINELRQS